MHSSLPRFVRCAVRRRAHKLATQTYEEFVQRMFAALDAGELDPAAVPGWAPPGVRLDEPTELDALQEPGSSA